MSILTRAEARDILRRHYHPHRVIMRESRSLLMFDGERVPIDAREDEDALINWARKVDQ